MYPALTGSKTLISRYKEKREDRWGINCPLKSDWFGPTGCWSSGVATGRGAFHFRSSSSVGDEENPH
ncbi:hypothetical protein [Rummeliibacillus suwonensis]|uniref:hypothetical protein n=1 Tax=Rummeliibacillus suwonensis TaxID=1306154 RepID=UPI002899005F|nr:hypothetical protein [Rummeliibacillus suwonensis]